MSKIENSDLTAGGDAPPVEVIKTDCTDNTVTIIEVKNTDAMSDDATASAEKVAKEFVLSVRAENERLIEATNDINVLSGEEVTNPDAHTEEPTNMITEIAHTVAEDMNVQTEMQRSAEEPNNSAIILQSEETSQSKSVNEEKVKIKAINDRFAIYNYYNLIQLCVVSRSICQSKMQEVTMQHAYPD